MDLSHIALILLFYSTEYLFAFNPLEETTEMDYMSAAYAVRNLARTEQKILKVLIHYKNAMEKRLEAINRYDLTKVRVFGNRVLTVYSLLKHVSDFLELTPHRYTNEIVNAMAESKTSFHKIQNISIFDLDAFADEATGHLFKSFHVIQRFATIWPEVDRSVQDYEPKDRFWRSVGELRKGISFPTDNDVIQSMFSIVRLKQTYNVSANELFDGNLKGFQTNSGLSKRDLFEFGKIAFRLQQYPMCFEFLEKYRALISKESTVDPKLIEEVDLLMGKAIVKHDHGIINEKFQLDRNPFHFQYTLQSLESDSFRLKVPALLTPDITNLSNPLGIATAFDRLCSGQDLRNPSLTKNFKCTTLGFGQTVHYFALQPLKVEYLSDDPLILLIHDVLLSSEIDKILKAAEPELQRSRVAGEKGTNIARTSTNTWFPDYEPTSEFNFISKRVELITQLRVNYDKASEQLQVANYGPGGLYAPHYDVARSPEDIVGETQMYDERGDRIATFMFYLSEIERGGGTAFPGVGIAIQPIRGSAVFWYNMHNDGSAHMRTLHGGCPVLHGSKWIANKWIRSHEQMFIKKCVTQARNV